MNRRSFLDHLWQALAGLFALGAAIPMAVFWWRSPTSGEAGDVWIDLGSAPKIPEGEWLSRRFVYERRDRWRLEQARELVYLKREGRSFKVVTAVCPHTGCLVRRQGDGFTCPCHKSFFDGEGRSHGEPGDGGKPFDRDWGHFDGPGPFGRPGGPHGKGNWGHGKGPKLPPEIEPGQEFRVAENSGDFLSANTVAADDPNTGDSLTFSIIDGNDAGLFAIDPNTGALSVLSPGLLDYESGETELRRDDEWRRNMRWHERAIVTSLTWPLLLGYGFGRDRDGDHQREAS